MNKKETALLEKVVYPEGTTFKSDDELMQTDAKRQPRMLLEVGDVVKFPPKELFKIAVVPTTIGKETFKVESIGVVVVRDGGMRAIKFPVSWLASVGFPVYWVGQKDDADDYDDTQKESSAISGHSTAHQGDAVTAWQSCKNQLEARNTFANKSIVVESVVEYVVGQYDKKPKPIFELVKKG